MLNNNGHSVLDPGPSACVDAERVVKTRAAAGWERRAREGDRSVSSEPGDAERVRTRAHLAGVRELSGGQGLRQGQKIQGENTWKEKQPRWSLHGVREPIFKLNPAYLSSVIKLLICCPQGSAAYRKRSHHPEINV